MKNKLHSNILENHTYISFKLAGYVCVCVRLKESWGEGGKLHIIKMSQALIKSNCDSKAVFRFK